MTRHADTNRLFNPLPRLSAPAERSEAQDRRGSNDRSRRRGRRKGAAFIGPDPKILRPSSRVGANRDAVPGVATVARAFTDRGLVICCRTVYGNS